MFNYGLIQCISNESKEPREYSSTVQSFEI